MRQVGAVRVVTVALLLGLGVWGFKALAHECGTKDIVEVAVEAGQFKTLATALQAAGLVETLKGKGPFTVFAPTDEAFAKLPPGTLEALLKDKERLTAVLTYHVLAGEYPAAKVVASKYLKTVQGASIKISVTEKGAKANEANILKTDIRASNGIIHVIDAVLLPPEKKEQQKQSSQCN